MKINQIRILNFHGASNRFVPRDSPVGFNVWPFWGDEDDLSDSEMSLAPMVGHNGTVAKHYRFYKAGKGMHF
jgi:hypothetical protein